MTRVQGRNTSTWFATRAIGSCSRLAGRGSYGLNDTYILGGDDGHTPIEEPDLLKSGRWVETGNRIVKQESIGHYWISTVFLGLDHNHMRLFNPDLPPILFETMVFCNAPGKDPENLTFRNAAYLGTSDRAARRGSGRVPAGCSGLTAFRGLHTYAHGDELSRGRSPKASGYSERYRRSGAMARGRMVAHQRRTSSVYAGSKTVIVYIWV